MSGRLSGDGKIRGEIPSIAAARHRPIDARDSGLAYAAQRYFGSWGNALTAAGLAVPIGLSYVTFQMISYLVDVWKGTTPVERNFLALAAYLLGSSLLWTENAGRRLREVLEERNLLSTSDGALFVGSP